MIIKNAKIVLSLILVLAISACGGGASESSDSKDASDNGSANGSNSSSGTGTSTGIGELEQIVDFESANFGPRNIDVWLPDGYEQDSDKQYRVMYVHDGQFLFRAGDCDCFNTVVRLNVAMQQLITEGKIEDTIVVGIWNGGAASYRMLDFYPENALNLMPEVERNDVVDAAGGEFYANEYLTYLVDDVMPMIESNYRVKTGPENTSVMGFSMSGVMAIYTMVEYPDVFGSVAAISPWWVDEYAVKYFEGKLPSPETHRIYLDMGNEGFEQELDWFNSYIEEAGYLDGESYLYKEFVNDDHNPFDWGLRIHFSLEFLHSKS